MFKVKNKVTRRTALVFSNEHNTIKLSGGNLLSLSNNKNHGLTKSGVFPF